MADEEKDRLVNQPGPDDSGNPPDDEETPPVNPEEDRGQEEEPEPGQGKEPAEEDYSNLTDEQLLKKIDEADRKALEAEGLGKFKSYAELIKAYKRGEAEASRIVNRVNRLAEYFRTNSDGLLTSLEAQMEKVPTRDARQRGQPPDKSEPGQSVTSEEIKRLQGAIGRTNLDRLFDKWQARKEAKDETEIPDALQADLEKLLPLVAEGKDEEELARMGSRIFDEAYDFHTWRQGKRKTSTDRIKLKLAQKRRQLAVTPSTRGGRTPVSETEAAAAFGFDTPP